MSKDVRIWWHETTKAKNVMVADGCVIEGTVENSILSRGVKISVILVPLCKVLSTLILPFIRFTIFLLIAIPRPVPWTLVVAIRRVFRPGSKFEVMLCLVGGQGAGKSTFFRLLENTFCFTQNSSILIPPDDF